MKKHSSMALVVFAVCMVSYSGPMVKGALNAVSYTHLTLPTNSLV